MGKVLVVDDEPDILYVIKARIESIGHQVVTADDGEKAFEILKKERFDLVISDVVMPAMDGFQLYKELKKNPDTAKIPVLILTARGKMEDTFRVIGVDGFMSKPFETDDFMNKVKELLHHQNSPPPPVVAPVISIKAGAKILLSGSDQEIVAKMAALLMEAGYPSETAVVGPDLLAKSTALVPKLIILDVLMPDSPTEEIIKRLRQMALFQKTPIIFYSFIRSEGGDDIQQHILSIEAAKENCLNAGATGDIGSFNEKTFVKIVSGYLK
jgi:CheY-like chemotaxis protein